MSFNLSGVRNPADLVAGLVLVAIAILAFIFSHDLPSMVDYRFTAGTAPRLAALLLGGFGVAICILAFLRADEENGGKYPVYAIRGPLVVAAAVVLFAVTVKPLGLLLSCYLLFVMTSLARPNPKWVEVFIAAAVMSAGCVAVFIYLLKLPYPVLPGQAY